MSDARTQQLDRHMNQHHPHRPCAPVETGHPEHKKAAAAVLAVFDAEIEQRRTAVHAILDQLGLHAGAAEGGVVEAKRDVALLSRLRDRVRAVLG